MYRRQNSTRTTRSETQEGPSSVDHFQTPSSSSRPINTAEATLAPLIQLRVEALPSPSAEDLGTEWIPMETVPLPPHLAVHKRWHPKLSAYRLLVLFTAIGIGCAKVATSVQGGEFVPITLEWVGGVLVFLVLYILSIYDSTPLPPPKLAWLYKYDCVDILWPILRFPKPVYLSNEIFPMPTFAYDRWGRSTNTAFFTPYRLLVTASLTGFGIAKAAFGYLRFNTAATWVDWVIGVVLGVGLYVVGLYEYNSIGMWRDLFTTDCGPLVLGARKFTQTMSLSLLCLCWILGSLWCLKFYVNDDELKFGAPARGTGPSRMAVTPLDGFHDFCVKVMGCLFILVSVASGFVWLGMIYTSVKDEFWWFITGMRRAANMTWIWAARKPVLGSVVIGLETLTELTIVVLVKVKNGLMRAVERRISWRYQVLIFHLAIHTVLHIIAIFLVFVLSFNMFGMAYRVYVPSPIPEEESLANAILFGIVRHVFLLFGAGCMLAGLGGCVMLYRSLVEPYKRLRMEGYTRKIELLISS